MAYIVNMNIPESNGQKILRARYISPVIQTNAYRALLLYIEVVLRWITAHGLWATNLIPISLRLKKGVYSLVKKVRNPESVLSLLLFNQS